MIVSLDRHEYIADELIIGGSLNALLYAWFTGSTLLSIDPKEPYFFERFSTDAQLHKVGMENKISKLRSPKGEILTGACKSEVWRRLYFLLAMAGQAPIPNTAQSIRIEEGVVKITTSHSRMARFRFEKLKIFDASAVGLKQINAKMRKYKVIDWIWVNTGMVHEFDCIHDHDDFVKDIYFYAYNHRGGRDLKNLVAISYLTGEELEEYHYSDTYAKFKTEHLMKESGIRGRKNGFRNGVPYHLNVKVTPKKRELVCIDNYHLDLTAGVEHCQLTDEEILKQFDGPPQNKNIRKLLRYWR